MHPHQSFIDQIKISIENFVPLTPGSLTEKANQLVKDIEENPQAPVSQIHQALAEIGREEYPYRKAYHDLCDDDEEARQKKLILERLDDDLKAKLEEALQYMLFDDYVASPAFEDLAPEDRAQVDNAYRIAEETLDKQCDERASSRAGQYDELLLKYKDQVKSWQAKIDYLRELGKTSPEHADELNAVADRLEEGWSVTEKDPSEEEIDKEIEYWKTVTATSHDELSA